jgi:hypothetical protein
VKAKYILMALLSGLAVSCTTPEPESKRLPPNEDKGTIWERVNRPSKEEERLKAMGEYRSFNYSDYLYEGWDGADRWRRRGR